MAPITAIKRVTIFTTMGKWFFAAWASDGAYQFSREIEKAGCEEDAMAYARDLCPDADIRVPR